MTYKDLTKADIEALTDKASKSILQGANPSTIEDLCNFVVNGMSPGTFLYALLTNNLVASFQSADTRNIEAMEHHVRFLYWALPSQCWGTPDKVREWRGQ